MNKKLLMNTGGLVLVYLLKWPIIQLVAWCYMLLSYSFKFGFTEAWSMTFSGEHPCVICQIVKTGSAGEGDFWLMLVSNQNLILIPACFILIASAAMRKVKTTTLS